MTDKINSNIHKLQRALSYDYYEITEKDFYPPKDTRIVKSLIEDIHGGDNFYDYFKWFYDNYENEIFDN